MPRSPDPTTLRLGTLARRPRPVDWSPDAETRARIAEGAGARGLRKLRLSGDLHPEGKADWRFEGMLGATAVQDCVVTLEPVTTRLDVRVARRYLAEPPPEAAGETEMPGDADEIEPLPDALDLAALAEEALALALPEFPRAEGAEAARTTAAPPGAAPLMDEERRPFAGLADLKAKLEEGG